MVFSQWCYGNLCGTAAEQSDRDDMCDTLVCFHRANNHTAHLSTRLDLDLDLDLDFAMGLMGPMDPVDDLFARIGFQSEAAWMQALWAKAWTQA